MTSLTTQLKINPNKHILKILSLNYNNNELPLKYVTLSIKFINGNKKTGNSIKQAFNISDSMKIVLHYSERENTTQITIQEFNKDKKVSRVEGFKRLVVFTNKGSLNYQIK